MRLHGLSYLERRGGGRLQRRHPGSEAIDWPTGVSKHCCSRSPITQHALCSSEMCPTGTHRRIGDRFAPFAPSGAPLPSHLELVFFPLSVGNFGITSADWMGPLQAAAIALIGCGTWNYLGLTAQPLHAPASSTSRAGWQFRLAGKVSSLALFMTIPAFATLNSPPPPISRLKNSVSGPSNSTRTYGFLILHYVKQKEYSLHIRRGINLNIFQFLRCISLIYALQERHQL